jgi:hypothetical protein
MSLILGCVSLTPSFAAPPTVEQKPEQPKMDIFIHDSRGIKVKETPPPAPLPATPAGKSTADKIGQGAFGMMSERTPQVSWFESFDTTVFNLRASDSDKVILCMSLNQDSDRVQKWTSTANKVAKNYRMLAQELKNLAVPPDSPGLQVYRDLTAEWYLDKAGIYEDLTRPRRPAKTMEELESDLNQIKERSDCTAETAKRLKEMENEIRKAYRVHKSRETDPLSQYVMGSLHKLREADPAPKTP